MQVLRPKMQTRCISNNFFAYLHVGQPAPRYVVLRSFIPKLLGLPYRSQKLLSAAFGKRWRQPQPPNWPKHEHVPHRYGFGTGTLPLSLLSQIALCTLFSLQAVSLSLSPLFLVYLRSLCLSPRCLCLLSTLSLSLSLPF